MKSDVWEGGHHIPFFVKWPGNIKAGSISFQTISLTDFFATTQSLFETDSQKAEDSFSFLTIAKGKETTNNRPPVIHHSGGGKFGIRDGEWKFIEGLGSGGFSEPKNPEPIEDGPTNQLYNLRTDPQEKENLSLSNPEKVKEMKAKLKEIRGF
jgi:arylsulfatase A-like enzyme